MCIRMFKKSLFRCLFFLSTRWEKSMEEKTGQSFTIKKTGQSFLVLSIFPSQSFMVELTFPQWFPQEKHSKNEESSENVKCYVFSDTFHFYRQFISDILLNITCPSPYMLAFVNKVVMSSWSFLSQCSLWARRAIMMLLNVFLVYCEY